MAEVMINPSVFEAVCQAEEEDEQGHSEVAREKIAEFGSLIFQGYSRDEATDALRAAGRQLQEVKLELMGF